jgi:hypothetical protein
VWRIPPWQPAALILLATVLIALDIYGHLSLGALLMAAFIAFAALVAAGCAARYLLVADEDGIWVRRIFGEQLIEWGDVAKIEMTIIHHNSMTVRITRADATHLDVPPSLLQPSVPTKMRKVRASIDAVATQLAEIAAQQRA